MKVPASQLGLCFLRLAQVRMRPCETSMAPGVAVAFIDHRLPGERGVRGSGACVHVCACT